MRTFLGAFAKIIFFIAFFAHTADVLTFSASGAAIVILSVLVAYLHTEVTIQSKKIAELEERLGIIATPKKTTIISITDKRSA